MAVCGGGHPQAGHDLAASVGIQEGARHGHADACTRMQYSTCMYLHAVYACTHMQYSHACSHMQYTHAAADSHGTTPAPTPPQVVYERATVGVEQINEYANSWTAQISTAFWSRAAHAQGQIKALLPI